MADRPRREPRSSVAAGDGSVRSAPMTVEEYLERIDAAPDEATLLELRRQLRADRALPDDDRKALQERIADARAELG